jgi:hypothetical protein
MNVLISADIIKARFGWSGAELEENIHLVQVGQLFLELVAVLTQYQASAEIIQLVERVLQD